MPRVALSDARREQRDPVGPADDADEKSPRVVARSATSQARECARNHKRNGELNGLDAYVKGGEGRERRRGCGEQRRDAFEKRNAVDEPEDKRRCCARHHAFVPSQESREHETCRDENFRESRGHRRVSVRGETQGGGVREGEPQHGHERVSEPRGGRHEERDQRQVIEARGDVMCPAEAARARFTGGVSFSSMRNAGFGGYTVRTVDTVPSKRTTTACAWVPRP